MKTIVFLGKKTPPLARAIRSAGKIVTAAGFMLPLAGLAQELPSSAEARVGSIEEVVVTARRRAESLSRVPIAISAVNAEEILERSIRSDSDLQFTIPGLTIRQTQGNNSLTYAIRGQSADTFSGSPSAVVAYMNEVPMNISGASTFYDLESIQVLKGPQGTLFGRNTTGGAVLYTSAKPTDELEGRLRVRVGNYDLREVEGMINVPLIDDTLLLRAAFNTIERDGYIDNLMTGRKHGEVGRDSGRVSLTFRPNDRLENTTVLAYSENDSINTGASYTYSVYAPGAANNGFPLVGDAGFLFGPGLDAVAGPGAWDAYLAANPGAYAPGLIAYVDEQRRLGHYKTQHTGNAKHTGRDWLVTNTTSFELTDNIQLKNIFGASNARTDSDQPPLGAPYMVFVTQNIVTGKSGNESEVDSWSNELQISGDSFDGDLAWIAGLYIQRQEADTLWPQTYFNLSPILPPAVATNHFRIKTETEALYAQGTYSFTPGFRLTAGFRHTEEKVKIKQFAQADAFGAPGQSETFKKPSWEAGLEFDVTEDLFAYLKTRGSFRSGGFNGSAPPVDADATGGGNKFDAETTKDMEVGLKYLGAVFERPSSMNLAVYKQWIKDVQRIEFPNPPTEAQSIAVTANVPKMEVEGIELEASLMLTDWLQLGVSGAYTRARFTDGAAMLFGTLYSYSPVANTPRRSGSLWVQIDIPTDEQIGEMRLRAEVYSQSSMYFSNTAKSIAPDTKLPGYELINARFDWNNIMGSQFSTAVFGRNLANKDHFLGGMALGASLGHNAAAVGEPRTYGLEMTYAF